tara:strand:+ start:2457 stop:2603 length:147 start_codon:yes stop_codon:yes gene_type:complete
MIFTATNDSQKIDGGVDIFSPTGIFILTIGILFTVGLQLIIILKGKKD